MVVLKNPTRGALGSLLAIISIAGLFLPLHAEFLAAIQLIVYAGAIVVLLLFVIMMLGPDAAPASDRRGIVVRVLSGAFFVLGGAAALVTAGRTLTEGRIALCQPQHPSPVLGESTASVRPCLLTRSCHSNYPPRCYS